MIHSPRAQDDSRPVVHLNPHPSDPSEGLGKFEALVVEHSVERFACVAQGA